MAKNNKKNSKGSKMAATNSTSKSKIITIIVAVVAIIAILLGLTCCNKDTDPNKLKGSVSKKDKKEEIKKDKDKENKEVSYVYESIPTITPVSMVYTTEEASAVIAETTEEADTTAPVARVVYDVTDSTAGPVTVTIIATEEIQAIDGWTLSDDGKSLSKPITTNGSGTVTVKDLAGNETTVSYEVTNIDDTLPEAVSITYSDLKPTLGSVVVTIVASEPISQPDGWTLDTNNNVTLTKTVTESTEGTVTITDLVGNENTISYTVANIGKMTTTKVEQQAGGPNPPAGPDTEYTVSIEFMQEVSAEAVNNGPGAGGPNPPAGPDAITWSLSNDNKTITSSPIKAKGPDKEIEFKVNVTNDEGTTLFDEKFSVSE